MKLVSCLMLFFLLQMCISKHHRSSKKIIKLPLRPASIQKPNKKAYSHKTNLPILDTTIPHVGDVIVGLTKPAGEVTYTVMFDTQSQYSWVIAYFLDKCETNQNLMFNNHLLARYDGPPTNPETTPIIQKHFPGWVYGVLVNDTITFGYDRVRLEFIAAKKAHTSIAFIPYDGVIGLQYNPTKGNAVTKYCESIKAEKKFGFYFTRYGNDTGKKGVFSMCGIDESKFIAGSMIYRKVEAPDQWMIPMESIEVNGVDGIEMLKTDVHLVLINPNSNMIYGPEDTISQIYKILKAERIMNTEVYKVDCANVDKLPYLVIRLGAGDAITLDGPDYARKVNIPDEGIACQLLFRKTQEKYWTFGDIVMKNYYVVFDMDNNRIGFALSPS